MSTIARGSKVTASPAAVAAAAEFWEAVGILPVEVVVPEGAGVTLRCYVEDVARFLGRDGGYTKGLATLDLIVAGTNTARIQEAHKLLFHVLCEIVECDLPKQ